MKADIRVHSFLAHPLELNGFKEYPMEMAEVASMAMELFSMQHWASIFDNKEELSGRANTNRKGRYHVPWIAIIDKFQHWIYEHPTHSHSERNRCLGIHSEKNSRMT